MDKEGEFRLGVHGDATVGSHVTEGQDIGEARGAEPDRDREMEAGVDAALMGCVCATVGMKSEGGRAGLNVGQHGWITEKTGGCTGVEEDGPRGKGGDVHKILMMGTVVGGSVLIGRLLAGLITFLLVAMVAALVATGAWFGTVGGSLSVSIVLHARIEEFICSENGGGKAILSRSELVP